MRINRAGLFAMLLAALLLASAPAPAFAADSLEIQSSDEDGYDDGGDEEDEETDLSSSDSKADYERQIDALNAQIEQIGKKKKQLQGEINQANSALSKLYAANNVKNQEIGLNEQEVELRRQRVSLLKGQIGEQEEKVRAKQADIDAGFELYKKRLRANYVSGESSKLSMVLGASDMTDFLMRGEIMKATAEHDRQIKAQLEADRTALEEEQAKLEAQQKAVEAEIAQLGEQRALLEEELAAQLASTQDLEAERLAYQRDKAAADRDEAALQKQIAELYEMLKPQMSDEFVGGEFAWPLPGHTQITSPYQASDRSDNHTGTDIAGGSCYGKKIVAANDGKVIFTAANNSGYGHYVIVDHGGGYSTLYAHMSAISVSVGDTVQRGVTKIGAVGATGWATGPHLHFEVRINGKPVNPMSYIT